jgi:[acyl-carrier-protein] S-malonyltransferase
MVSVLGLDMAKLEEVCAAAGPVSAVRIANYLCPGNYAVSGESSACATVESLAMAAGAMKTVRLAVAGAFHTALMQPAVEKLVGALAEVTPGEPRLPVWANVSARPYANGSEVLGLLPRQVVEPVLWEQTLRGLLEAGCDRFYEIGPGRVLTGTLKRIQRRADCRNVSA